MAIRRVHTLTPLNYQIKIPGYAQAFTAQDLRFDPDRDALLVRTDMGIVTLEGDDGIDLEVLDLDIPTILREQSADSGWLRTSIQDLIQRLRITFLMEE